MVKGKKSSCDNNGKELASPFKNASLLSKENISPFKRNSKASLGVKKNQLGGKKFASVLKIAIAGNSRVIAIYFENTLNKDREPFNWHLKQLIESRDSVAEDLHIFQTRCSRNTPPGDDDVKMLNHKGYPWTVFLAFKNENQDIWDHDSCLQRAMKICAVRAKTEFCKSFCSN